ncbi:MAG: Hsp33 family molecular chaperone HslO [Archangium sp.]|nr:Hsp33 family molecular chaperone HslO [Archangium sp.]
MSDSVVRALLDEPNLKVSVAVLGEVARDARRRHSLAPASASLFAQGLVGGALMASLGKGSTRINLQLECDGPLRGFFVDAATDGDIRGFVKNPSLDVELASGVFQWRAALGNSGFISVLRDVGGEFYRSSVELISMRFGDDLNHYFATSDQVPTRVAITVQRNAEEALGHVAGVLIQLLPSGDEAALKKLAGDLEARLHDACEKLPTLTAAALCSELFPQARQLLDTPVKFACTCSREKALATLQALGADEVQDIVDTMGSTAVTCQFCGTKHEVTLPDLWEILAALGRPVRPN